uniref:Uncharacterized protein n=1 Tax=Alexandrium catenella TaxID=2925 RepID=A0A7S1QZN9_ALECA
MVAGWLSAAVGGAAGGALNLFNYNRDAWMVDAQLTQHRRMQKQALVLSQASMFREDVQEIVGAATVRQSNYILVLTLVLGMVGVSYTFGDIPDEAQEFVQTAYTLCIGSSLLYLVISVLCAMSSNHSALRCQRDMLVHLVRLPIEDLALEIDVSRDEETVEAFERKGAGEMMRPPGVHLLRRRTVDSPTSRSAGEPAESGSSAAHAVWDMEARMCMYMEVLRRKEADWNLLGIFALIYGALGTGDLLQAFAYLLVARFYLSESMSWAICIVQVLFTLVDVSLLVGTAVYVQLPVWLSGTQALAAVGGQFFCTMAVRYKPGFSVGDVCVPLCFACHIVRHMIGCASLSRWPFRAAQTYASPSVKHTMDAARGLPRNELKRTGVARVGTMIVIFAWLLSLSWALWHAASGTANAPSEVAPSGGLAGERRLQEKAGEVSALQDLITQLERELEEERSWGEALQLQLQGLEAAVEEDRSCRTKEVQQLSGELGDALRRAAARRAAPPPPTLLPQPVPLPAPPPGGSG